MTPDYDLAAVKAMEILAEYNVAETPISPLPFLLNNPSVRVISFAKMANDANMDRDELIPLFVANQDAATFNLAEEITGVRYVVVYNTRMPYEIIWRGLARELGHIVLGHDGITRPYEVRRAEAMCFAHHLLSPRPILRLLQESGVPTTMNMLADTTGCIDECVYDMQSIPGTNVPKEINRRVRSQFEHRINEYIRFYRANRHVDRSQVIDFGTFMDGYIE